MTIDDNQLQKGSGYQLSFDDWIIKDLARSGLTPDNFTIEPLRSEEELRERLGFAAIQDKSGQWLKILDIGGYWIPYPNVPGYYRLKLREKIGDAKYLSPSGKGNHAYIVPQVAEIAKWIEEKKIRASGGTHR